MKSLYLTAIVPDAELTDQIEEIRRECAECYNVKAALKPPVHITLFKPISVEFEREKELVRVLNEVSSKHQPFTLSLENFDTFNNQVVFIKVLKTEPLGNLQKDISSVYHRRHLETEEIKSKKTFHPHITIAYRDIPRTTFPALWNEYKNKRFKRNFSVNGFILFKHNGHKWEVFEEFTLRKVDESLLF